MAVTDYAAESIFALLDGDDLTDEQYDLSDRITEVLRSYPPERTWTPSELARRARAGDTNKVYPVLAWMARHCYVRTYGNGAWTRYGRWTSTLSPR